MLGLLGAVAEFERSVIRERQAEVISEVKEKGIYRGRARSLSDTEIFELHELVEKGLPKAKVANQLGVSRATVYRYLKTTKQTSTTRVWQSLH